MRAHIFTIVVPITTIITYYLISELYISSTTFPFEYLVYQTSTVLTKRNAPLEPFSSDLSLSVEFLQQMRNVARACAEAQETSINVARTPPGIQLHSDVESTSRSRSTSPVVTRPQIVPVELSDHHSGIATSIPDVSSGIKNREPVAAATSHLGLASDTNVHYIRQRPATFDESQAVPTAKWDRIRDPTPIRKISEVVTSPIVAFAQTAMVLDTNANDPATVQVNTAANAADPPSVDSQWNWEDRVAKQRLRNNDLQNSGASNILDQGIGFDRSRYPVDKAHTPREVWDRREEMFLPPRQEIAAAVAATQLQRSWENRVANQRLRNNDLRKSGVSNIPDQGIGFNRSGYPVDKSHTPREVWVRREDMYPPQYTGRVGYSPTNQQNPQYNCGNGPPGDNGDVDGNGRDNKSRKGKKPARRHRMPWDDSSEGESPPPPPPSSPSSSSKESSLSDNDWIGAFAPNNEFLDKKVRRKLRCKAIKKLRARTDNDERRESWLKGILREYQKQIRHYCNRETVQSTEMPKSIKIPNPSRFTGSNDVEEFDTWLLALLRWIVISRLVGKVNNDQRVQVVGSFLDEDVLRWYNNEVTGLHCSQLHWTFKKVILGLFARFVQATTIHVAAEKFEATEYDPEKGVWAYKAELQRWGSRMTRPPNSYALRRKFLDGLPTSIISEMIERSASPDLATLSKMVKTVEQIEDNKALENFYLTSRTSVEEPDDFGYKFDVEWHAQEEIVGHHWDGDNLVFHTEWNTDEGVGDPGQDPTAALDKYLEQHGSLTGPQNAFTGNTTDVGPSPTSYPSGFTPHPPSYPPQSQFLFAHPPPSQAHYALLNPGFSNHGFQSQSQGSNPSSFVFGSIPPSAGSNPNFAAGYNPVAMAAFVIDEPSFRAATSGCVDYYRRSAVGNIPAGGDVASLTQRIGELSAELASKQLGYEDLHRKYYDDRHGKRKRTTRDGPSMAPTTASSQNKDEEMLSSAGIDPVETTVGEMEPVLSFPPQILPDGGYRTSEGYIVYGNEATDAQRNDQLGLPIARGGEEAHADIKKAEEVTSAIQYLSLACILRDFDDSGVNSGNLPWPVFKVCRDLYREVCKVPAGQQNALERTVFSNFFRPRFVEYAYNRDPKRDRGKGRAMPELELSSSYTEGSLPTAITSGRAMSSTSSIQALLSKTTILRRRPGGQTGLKNPAKSDPPEAWARYYHVHPNTMPPGIFCDSSNHISLRSVQGRLLVHNRAPKLPQGTIALERNRFLLLLAELFATPGLYASLIMSTGATVAPEITVSTFPDDTQNATLEDVARFYASQGITVLMGEDTAVFALTWIIAFRPSDSLTVNEALMIRGQVESALSTGNVPAGLNDNMWAPEGLVSRPSHPIPGVGFFPAPLITDDGGLSYDSPPNAITSSSNSAGASGSSSSNTALAQSEVPPTAPMEGINAPTTLTFMTRCCAHDTLSWVLNLWA
ncbi:hypothetical protein BT96DRAFT_945272 [Gymnopus androsaceus JB14]|uniref:Uncharacterized protein n=1 Tax=Gymnopus androsaceus JB14 TaxID=1447944 RepID=A0A6A4H1N1_9AGAR|nr:hypothetical protein BT96DRAFT_945272 [Gymnopus androsaceus JB14]